MHLPDSVESSWVGHGVKKDFFYTVGWLRTCFVCQSNLLILYFLYRQTMTSMRRCHSNC